MNQTRTGSRIVVIGGMAPATGKAAWRVPANQRPTPRRIIIIKNGGPVCRRPGR
jgi:hypothetical protein